MDIATLLEQFCEYSISFKGFSKDTIRRYRYVVTSFCRFMDISSLEQVTEQRVRDLFVYGRGQRKWSVNTYLVYRKSLLVFFRWCIKQGHMQANPVSEIEIPKKEKQLPKNLTEQQALRILEVVSNLPYQHPMLRYRNHAIFSTFLYAGLRKNELVRLKFADVDLQNSTLFIRQGKGGKDRIVPLCAPLKQSLSKYIAERTKLGKTHPELFSSFRMNKGLTENGLKKIVGQVIQASGVKFTIHMLRHTFATLMLEGGCDIYSLSKLMGHENIQTTTIYLGVSAEHLRNEIYKHKLLTY